MSYVQNSIYIMKSFKNESVCWILSLHGHRRSLSQNGPLYQVLPMEHYAFSTTILELASVVYTLCFVLYKYILVYLSAAMQFCGVRSVYDSGTHHPFAVKLTQDHYRECSTARLYIQPHFVLVFLCEKLNKLITRLRFPKQSFCSNSTLEL